jgi:membrane fusion protein, copper/silver efflux system
MKMRNKKTDIVLLLQLMILSMVIISSCKNNINPADIAGPGEYYTCSMDPQVIENKAGNCPICHMKLIKVKNNNLKAGQIKLSKQQIELANITFDTLRIHELSKEITLTGKVTVDQNISDAISSRVQGRIEKLAVRNIGDHISKGQLLYEIYSEDLNALQQEYIIAIEKGNFSSADKNLTIQFKDAAKNKLLLYGLSESQINQLQSSKQVLQTVPVFSKTDGFVSEISIVEGNYVSTGATLFRLSSLNSLWVEAQVYLPYLPFVKNGTKANFFIPASGEKIVEGKVIFIDPQVQSPERFVLARFQITDPSEEIKPGMLANITLKTETKTSLTLPVDAIIRDSKGANVWVHNRDGVFENKMITIGMQNSRQVEIIDGLNTGDVVVITGAYLLNSEYIFKKGANPMEGMKM